MSGAGSMSAGHAGGKPGDGAPATIDEMIAERIEEGKIGPVQFRIFLLCVILAIIDGYDLASMGLAVPLIAKDWSVASGSFGGALAAVMIGVAVGNIFLGWLGDRIGRKPVLIVSTLAIGLASLGTIMASSVTIMMLCRFVLGLAFGAGMPNMYSMVADVVPARNRMVCMTLVTAGASIGGILGGLVAPALSDRLGWEGIFLAGGLFPLTIGVLMIFLLRESPSVLASHGRLPELKATLAAFGLNSAGLPDAPPGNATGAVPTTAPAIRPTELLRDGLFPVTALYLTGWICSAFTYYVLANWLPTLLTDAGWESGAAQHSVTFLYAGNLVGALLLAWIMDRWQRGGIIVPAIAYAVGVVLFIIISRSLSSPGFYLLLTGVGLAVGGAQYVLPALSSRIYPLRLLTTALSWMGALSRIGGICGPLVVGWMLLGGMSGVHILTALSLVPLLAAISFAGMAVAAARRSRNATAEELEWSAAKPVGG
jgi:AAHS family 4-hydroxybenzoate transporter-like MFS transporter